MDISPNEALTYAQSAQGVLFARVQFIDRFEDEDLDAKQRKISASARRPYFYKVPLDTPVEVGSVVIAQVLDGKFGIGKVMEVLDEPPASTDYDYTYAMKWVVGSIDLARSKGLSDHDRASLKAISRASLKSRIKEMNEVLGFDLAKAVPALPGKVAPPIEDAEVIDEGDTGFRSRQPQSFDEIFREEEARLKAQFDAEHQPRPRTDEDAE